MIQKERKRKKTKTTTMTTMTTMTKKMKKILRGQSLLTTMKNKIRMRLKSKMKI